MPTDCVGYGHRHASVDDEDGGGLCRPRIGRQNSSRDVSDPRSGSRVWPRPRSGGRSRPGCQRVCHGARGVSQTVWTTVMHTCAPADNRPAPVPRSGGGRLESILCRGVAMSVIKVRTRGKQFVSYRVRLDRDNHRDVHAYATFIGEDAEYVVNAVMTPCWPRTRSVAWHAGRTQSFVPPPSPDPVARAHGGRRVLDVLVIRGYHTQTGWSELWSCLTTDLRASDGAALSGISSRRTHHAVARRASVHRRLRRPYDTKP